VRGDLARPTPTAGEPSDLRRHRIVAAVRVVTTPGAHRRIRLPLLRKTRSPSQLHHQRLSPRAYCRRPGRVTALFPTVESWERIDWKSSFWWRRSLA
jgi:hypothetical protein